MFKSKLFECFFVFVFLLIFSIPISLALNDDDATFQNGIHHFTSNFIQILHQNDTKNQSILFSPINIYAALLLLHLGTNSTTRDEITSVVEITQPNKLLEIHEHFSRLFEPLTNLPGVNESEEYNLYFNDLIFVDRINLKKRFVNLARSYYVSNIVRVNFLQKDFDAVAIVNRYIANTIKNSFSSFYKEPQTPFLKVILTSSLYFKSWWSFSFQKSTTKSETFYKDDGLEVVVPMMRRVGPTTYANLSWLSSEVGCLKANPNISVYIILPYKELNLRHLLDKLTSDHFNRIVRDVFETRRVDFKLPSFELQWSRNLDQPLYDLGAKEMFTLQADFQNMTNSKGLNVSEIKYKADIRITEYGIEAVSVTGVKITSSSVVEPNPDETTDLSLRSPHVEYDNNATTWGEPTDTKLYVNRPFFMFIYRHDINSVMFVASVNDPTE